MDKSRSWLVVLVLVLLPTLVQAATIKFAWDYSGDRDNLTGFHLYQALSGVTPLPLSSLIAIASPEAGELILDEVLDGSWDWYLRAESSGVISGPSNVVNLLVLAQHYWICVVYDYDPLGRVKFKGDHYDENPPITDINWRITFYEYNSDGRLIKVRIRIGPWSEREVGW